MRTESSFVLFANVFLVHEQDLERGGVCSRQLDIGVWNMGDVWWRPGRCQCLRVRIISAEEEKGKKLKVKPGGGGGHVHGAGEAVNLGREAEKEQREEWCWVNQGGVQKGESSSLSPI